MQALYQKDMEGTPLAKLLDEFHQHRLGQEVEDEQYADAEVDFFDDIVKGVDARQRRSRRCHRRHGWPSGWSLKRLDKTMLQILRSGTYELIARADIPKARDRSANMSMWQKPSSTTAKRSSSTACSMRVAKDVRGLTGEFAFIEALRSLATHPAARGLLDDAAVLEVGDETLVLTHDAMVEGVHWLPAQDMADVAWKLVATNLSDLAAKGAEPIGVMLSHMLGEG